MNRLVRRQRAALALFIAMTVSGIGVALADPQGEQPNVKIDVSPSNGQNLPTPASIQVTGTGFASNQVGTSGLIVQTAELTNGTSAVSVTLGTFTSSSQGTFSTTVNVSQTFLDAGSGAGVNCNDASVVERCLVEATSNSGNFKAAHTISFGAGGGGTTTTTVTIPPVTTTLPPVTTTLPPVTTTLPPVTTTLPPVTTTLPPVTTTLPPVTTTLPPVTTTTIGGPTTTLGPTECAALRQARASFNAQIDGAKAAVMQAGLTAAQQAAALAQLEAIRAQGNAQIDARLAGCPAP